MGEPTMLPRCRGVVGEAVAIGRLLSPAVREAAKTIEKVRSRHSMRATALGLG